MTKEKAQHAGKPAHTPGPWTVENTPSGAYDVYAYGVGPDYRICELVDGIGNAALIAAAPDLLEALKDCAEWADGFDDKDEPSWIKRVREAIAKAERV